MSNAVFASAKQAALAAYLTSAVVKVVLVDTATYTYSAAHTALSDIPSGARIATTPALTGKTFTGGTFDADDATITGVTGASIEAGVVYVDTGVPSTSTLLSFHDGLTLTPSGVDVIVQFNASGIFSI